ncbi:MAG: hypothetical protein WC471_03790 [Candidatus Woesearchaeota archaeon]
MTGKPIVHIPSRSSYDLEKDQVMYIETFIGNEKCDFDKVIMKGADGKTKIIVID